VSDELLRSADVVGELMQVTAGLRRLARRRLAEKVAGPRLPEAQRELLLVVEAQPGIGVAGAATALALAGNSVSTLVNTLVDAGMLYRDIDPADRRAARLTLTEAAKKRLSTWRTERSRMLGAALDRAGVADREAIAAALPALRRLLEELRNDVGRDA
jgi:DNA-binding MarR family transcriptional regulator